MTLKNLLLIVFISFSLCVHAKDIYIEENESAHAFAYLNHLRLKAGMNVFSLNTLLNKAALSHAIYCHDNRIGGHFETAGLSGFTGVDHVERANAVGYRSKSTGENVSFHKSVVDYKKSVDGLMGAIYHRFGFLSFDYDEIGIGIIQDDSYSSYVYNMGNMSKNEMCLSSSSITEGRYYDGACDDENLVISAEEFDAVTVRTQNKNRSVVVWPASGGEDVPPAFFEESPDPLPDYGVSGYPVSVQFNPSSFPDAIPVVTRFELIDMRTALPIEIIKKIDKNTDHHKKFTDYEHAIFPQKRLDWSSRYRVEVDYIVGDVSENIVWHFDTRDLNVPIYEIVKQDEVIEERPGNMFAVYLPPRHNRDADLSYRTKYRGLSALDISIVDGNTLLVKPSGKGEAEITFHNVRIRIEIE